MAGAVAPDPTTRATYSATQANWLLIFSKTLKGTDISTLTIDVASLSDALSDAVKAMETGVARAPR